VHFFPRLVPVIHRRLRVRVELVPRELSYHANTRILLPRGTLSEVSYQSCQLKS
jgi:hypothetical protein